MLRAILFSMILVVHALAADGPPPSHNAMRRECADVPEELIRRIDDAAQRVAETRSSLPGTGSRGAVMKRMRQWIQEENLTTQVSDKCVVEIVRIAHARVLDAEAEQVARTTKETRDRLEAEQLATWNALSETEKRWAILAEEEWARNLELPPNRRSPAKFAAPVIGCGIHPIEVGDMGIIQDPVSVTNITSERDAIAELKCPQVLSKLYRKLGLSEDDVPYQVPESVGVWISGLDTSTLTTGCTWPLVDVPFHVVGTRTYATAMGSERTVFHVNVLTLDPRRLAVGNLVVPKEFGLRGRYGFRVDDKWSVFSVLPGWPADSAGLYVDDVIVAINDRRASDIPSDERSDSLKQSPLRLQVSRGGKIINITMRLP